jgi:DNA-binding NarL/FixJ family response regulator
MCQADRVEEILGATFSPRIRRLHELAVGMIEERVDVKRFAQVSESVSTADLTAEIAAALALTRHETAHQAHTSAVLGLTQHERDVLQLMAAGRSNREIGAKLFLSVGTVKVHVTHVLAKLGVKSRAAATD